MNQLTKYLISEILDGQKVTAVFGGGFKPPTKGHFDIVKKALDDHKEIDKFIIYVGGGVRDGITQEQAIQIWQMYKEILGDKVEIIPSKNPIGDVKRYPKNNKKEKVYFVIGAREGREDDLADVAQRTAGVEEKYPNTEVKLITTPDGGMSGTNARKALKSGNKEEFFTYLPEKVPASEKESIWDLLNNALVKETEGKAAPYGSGYKKVNENTIPSIDIVQKCAELTQHMIDKGYNIQPLPSVKFISDDSSNAEDFLGKTAYYNPDEKMIVLYTYGRHPKDIVRSFAHEMIHHMQNLEGRIGNGDIKTTNTNEDDYLKKIEAEANLKGTMTFRNWTDSLKENKQINYTNPNFTEEWEEAIRYPEFKEMGKNGWLKTANHGKPVSYSSIKDKLGNVDLDFEGLEEPKKQRFLNAFEKGTIEMPIAVKFSDSDYDLVAGNTRLSGLVKKGINPRIWIVDISNIQEKKNKDPFGLNQYARELVQGLE